MVETGLVIRWKKKFWPKENECTVESKPQAGDNREINIAHMEGSFWVLGVGFLISFFLLGIELLRKRRELRDPNSGETLRFPSRPRGFESLSPSVRKETVPPPPLESILAHGEICFIPGKTQRVSPSEFNKENLFRKTGYSEASHYSTDYGQSGTKNAGYAFESSNQPFRYSGFPNRTDLIPYNYPARRY